MKISTSPERMAELRKRYPRSSTGREPLDLDLILSSPPDLEMEAHLQRVAAALKSRYSDMPFYAKRAAANPDYWRKLAASAWNAI